MKKLYKVEEGKMICGVCGGIAEYFNLDPALVRIATVILSCIGGGGLIAYIVAAIILPTKNDALK
jgi:phage shock protein C